MTTSRFSKTVRFTVFIAALLHSAGCAPPKSQAFHNSFLPPPSSAYIPADDVMIPEPPAAAPSDLYAKERPNLLPADLLTPRNTEIENRLRQADAHYIAGQRAYQRGEMEIARREFNEAVDVLLKSPENGPERSRIERRLEQLVEDVYRYDVNGLGSGDEAPKLVYDKSPLDEVIEMTFTIDPRLKNQVKEQVKEEVTATPSQLPLEANDSVLSYINFFSSDRGRQILKYGMQRSGRYRPMIQRILAEECVPQELIYLAQIESGFYPRAASYRAAVGMWQFVKSRGQEYGLKQTAYSDDRMDPEMATRAAARHLRDLHKAFGDWYLAMAAYNCGPGCVDSAVQRTGYADFWKLREIGILPKETTNYVPIIVAITIMMKNAKDYGLDQIEFDAPLEYDTVKLDVPTNLALIADAVERPVNEIRDLNPSLLRSVTPGNYDVRVPKGSATTLQAALEVVPESKRATWRIHKVEPGETLAVIARRYGAAPNTLAAANNSLQDSPSAGEILLVPVFEPKVKLVKATRRAPAKVLNKKAAVRTARAR